MNLIVRHPINAWRSYRARRSTCGCKLVVIEFLGGQHPAGCTGNRYAVVVVTTPAHRVDGVVMPIAGPRSPDLARRWCDLTVLDEMLVIGRNWLDLDLVATAVKADGEWYWRLNRFSADPADYGRPTTLDEGVAANVEEVQKIVEDAVADEELLMRLRRMMLRING